MKNILQISVATAEWAGEDADFTVTLANGKDLFIVSSICLRGDVKDMMDEELFHNSLEDFKKDLESFFDPDPSIQINWEYWESPQEMHVLFQETWETYSSFDGIEQDCTMEYIGLLDVDTINETNCYGGQHVEKP